MVAPVYTADYAGTWFPETKLDNLPKLTAGGSAIAKGVVIFADNADRKFKRTATTTVPPGRFAVSVKAAVDGQANVEAAVKGPVSVVVSNEVRETMKLKPSTTQAGQVEGCATTDVNAIGSYMGISTANVRDGVRPPTMPAGSVVIMDLNNGVS